MDYSQFLLMKEELSLIAVIVILFIADLFMRVRMRTSMTASRC